MVPHSIFLIRILPSKILEWVRVPELPGIRGMHPGKNYLKSSFIFDSFFTVANFFLLQQKIQKQGRNNYWKILNLACSMVQLQHLDPLFYFGSGSSSSKECRWQIPELWIWFRIGSGSRRAKMILSHRIKLIHFIL
jgi:hypothetical protein